MKLGVNLDHIATVRQARKEGIPDLVKAARAAEKGGADGITVHLREDRRHIQDADLPALKKSCRVPLNLEMALHADIIRIALRIRPEKVCIVPERRQELTTEGGLDVYSHEIAIKRTIFRLHQKKIEVSLFIAPSTAQIKAAARVGADAIEIHTGTYANATGAKKKAELARIRVAARLAAKLGLKVHAGHGLDYKNVSAIAGIPKMRELNIGFSIVAHSVFVGLTQAVREMKQLLR